MINEYNDYSKKCNRLQLINDYNYNYPISVNECGFLSYISMGHFYASLCKQIIHCQDILFYNTVIIQHDKVNFDIYICAYFEF